MRLDLFPLSLVLVAACAGHARSGPGSGVAIRDHRTCVYSGPALAADHQAVECAKVFVVLNGYTAVPATSDTSALAGESIEFGNSWQDVLQRRHGSLMPDPVGYCADSTGYVVGFRYAGDSTRTLGRGVTMTRHFEQLRVQHIGLNLTALRERQHGCRPITDLR